MELSNFKILNPIGRGGYGAVMLAKANIAFKHIAKDELVAMKIIPKKLERSIKIEVDVLKKVKGQPFLSQMLGCFQDRTDAFIILRYEENGSLATFLRRHRKVSVDYAQCVVVEVSLALNYLHERKIIHGDLKPANILIDSNMHVHVADYGLCIKFEGSAQMTGAWGTPCYQSPEQITHTVWSQKVDFFNLGIIFIELVNGRHPFKDGARCEEDVHKNIVMLNFKIPLLDNPFAKLFIQKTLCSEKNRLDGKSALSHPFIEPKLASVILKYQQSPPIIETNNRAVPFHDNEFFYKKLSCIENTDDSNNDNGGNGGNGNGGNGNGGNGNGGNGSGGNGNGGNGNGGNGNGDNGNGGNGNGGNGNDIDFNIDDDVVDAVIDEFLGEIAGKAHEAGQNIQTQDRRKNGLKSVKAQLAKVQGAEDARIEEKADGIYIACSVCQKLIKTKIQTRGLKKVDAWSIQPFQRHFDKHRRKE